MKQLTWPDAAAWRVRRHYLDQRSPDGSLLAVASRLCGFHAQLLSSAELSAWARVEGLDREAVKNALWSERTLIKTWAMRGTLHLLPASELPLWIGALKTSRRFLKPEQWKTHFHVEMNQLDMLTEAIGVALKGRALTRKELAEEVGRVTGEPALSAQLAESSWGIMLRPAAFRGYLCFAPGIGQLVRFTRPSLRKPISSAVATAEVTRRFLAAYGPATVRDLARWWSGGGVVNGRQWIAALGDEVVPVKIEGTDAWMLASHAHELGPVAKSVLLLPAFDP